MKNWKVITEREESFCSRTGKKLTDRMSHWIIDENGIYIALMAGGLSGVDEAANAALIISAVCESKEQAS